MTDKLREALEQAEELLAEIVRRHIDDLLPRENFFRECNVTAKALREALPATADTPPEPTRDRAQRAWNNILHTLNEVLPEEPLHILDAVARQELFEEFFQELTTDRAVCPVCDGGPGNDSACSCPSSTNSREVVNNLVVGINMEPTEEMVDAAMYELEGLRPKRHHVRRALEAALTVGATTCRGCGHWSHAMECHTLDCFCADRAALAAQKEG